VFVVRWATAVFFLLMLQVTWVSKLRIAGVGPDLFLGVVFVLALRRGVGWGVWTGFVLGLLIGVEQPAGLGLESLALCLAGLVVGRGARSLDRTNPLVMVVLLLASSLTAETVRVFAMAGKDVGAVPLLFCRWALPGAIYTMLFLPLLAWVVIQILGRRDWLTGAA
jgi:rod shape-determining protein MreD